MKNRNVLFEELKRYIFCGVDVTTKGKLCTPKISFYEPFFVKHLILGAIFVKIKYLLINDLGQNKIVGTSPTKNNLLAYACAIFLC